MQQFPSYWTLNEKVDFLQRKILLNSVAERQLGFDFLNPTFKKEILQQLVDLQKNYPDSSKTLYASPLINLIRISHFPFLYAQLLLWPLMAEQHYLFVYILMFYNHKKQMSQGNFEF